MFKNRVGESGGLLDHLVVFVPHQLLPPRPVISVPLLFLPSSFCPIHAGIITEKVPSRLRGCSPEPGFFSCEFLGSSFRWRSRFNGHRTLQTPVPFPVATFPVAPGVELNTERIEHVLNIEQGHLLPRIHLGHVEYHAVMQPLLLCRFSHMASFCFTQYIIFFILPGEILIDLHFRQSGKGGEAPYNPSSYALILQ